MPKESSAAAPAVRGSNLNPKGKRKNTSGSPRKTGDDRESEVRLVIYASAHTIAGSLALPAAMHPATTVLLPRADTPCLMHSSACSQVDDDEVLLYASDVDDTQAECFIKIQLASIAAIPHNYKISRQDVIYAFMRYAVEADADPSIDNVRSLSATGPWEIYTEAPTLNIMREAVKSTPFTLKVEPPNCQAVDLACKITFVQFANDDAGPLTPASRTRPPVMVV